MRCQKVSVIGAGMVFKMQLGCFFLEEIILGQ